MKIILYSIGKENDGMLKLGIEDFSKRISHYYPVEWKIIPAPKNKLGLPEKELKLKEAALILQSIKKEDYLVALDEKGSMLSSTQLASWIQTRANESVKQLAFLIGGAYGLDESVLTRANFVWSLSLLTFPHQLVRLILAEQIYRACTIIKNEKYHHA
ncbi:23S rRNA (pseudouridine(1915)-N(3))-methyltransferase RlmH [Agriterribacter sp.]|uniref:23S rRNA (pseudouridine(1915)-N(3))-methyltransferase RlmH n=1 Tax=Agriterribacter sp. TaxID=2821509 RepID=UPI002C1146CF|nr:23S rRNA (pseudouridine(1915)-N(3))-methyltransferase RlmH [Agriterribacter sp.]HRO47713.1 23S rRNA (pseudouridine(1915)-N(3))-methyltransferase RlmH [Agriterribacter sp.]HRQ18072.1 23S rRNA (pseudouridine(1915)-N(3))-methyltransferase RlmH [Agriterribacter sp.]